MIYERHINSHPYKGLIIPQIRYVRFIDFMDYYHDAKSIGFSDKKSMDYAWNCCLEEMQKIKKHLAL